MEQATKLIQVMGHDAFSNIDNYQNVFVLNHNWRRHTLG